jgi:hypothetical protein
VERIAMGKSHKKYEFGGRSRMASTNAGNIIVSATARRGRSFVGKPAAVLGKIEILTQTTPKQVHVDLSFRVAKLMENQTQIIFVRAKGKFTLTKKRRGKKRRGATEPNIVIERANTR